MENTENYQIKTKLNYYMLKDAAEERLFKACEMWVKQVKEAVILIGVCLFGIVFMPFLDDGFAFSKLVVYVSIVLMFYAVVFASFMIKRSVKKIKVNIEAYKSDLRKIEEKLIYSDEFVIKVTQEEYHEYDSVKYVIKKSLKRMKKST